MKVLLFTAYGGYAATPQMKEILSKYENKGIRGRIGEIVDYVENNHVLYPTIYKLSEIEKEFENNKELIVKFEDLQKHGYQKYMIYRDIGYSGITTFSIVDVDTTRPWTIEEYDGAEYIQYLDENKLIDKELNYYEKC